MPESTPNNPLLSPAQKDEVKAALAKKGAPRVCPICGTNNWAMGDGYIVNTLQADLKVVNLGGVGIPAVPLICANCGFISQHALGALGLLPRASQGEKNK